MKARPMAAPKSAVPAGAAAVAAASTATGTKERCLKCKRQSPGTYYTIYVARRQSISGSILYQESSFLCDRCARARLRVAPLVAFCLWIPVLVVGALFLRRRLWLSLPLVFLIVGLVKQAFRQFRAIHLQLYHRPPYSRSVARLAIQMRKRDILRQLHLSEAEVIFLTEADRGRSILDGGIK
jgi:hypothetical protein